jgi:hypothetical protein
MRREVDRFHAVDDDGRTYTVIVYQDFHQQQSLSGPPKFVPGSKDLRLSDGSYLSPTDDPDTFKIVETGKPIRRVR